MKTSLRFAFMALAISCVTVAAAGTPFSLFPPAPKPAFATFEPATPSFAPERPAIGPGLSSLRID